MNYNSCNAKLSSYIVYYRTVLDHEFKLSCPHKQVKQFKKLWCLQLYAGIFMVARMLQGRPILKKFRNRCNRASFPRSVQKTPLLTYFAGNWYARVWSRQFGGDGFLSYYAYTQHLVLPLVFREMLYTKCKRNRGGKDNLGQRVEYFIA